MVHPVNAQGRSDLESDQSQFNIGGLAGVAGNLVDAMTNLTEIDFRDHLE